MKRIFLAGAFAVAVGVYGVIMTPVFAVTLQRYLGTHHSGIVQPSPYETGEASVIPPLMATGLLVLVLGACTYYSLGRVQLLYRWPIALIAAALPLIVLAITYKYNFAMVFG